jgi:hypothetical protein
VLQRLLPRSLVRRARCCPTYLCSRASMGGGRACAFGLGAKRAVRTTGRNAVPRYAWANFLFYLPWRTWWRGICRAWRRYRATACKGSERYCCLILSAPLPATCILLYPPLYYGGAERLPFKTFALSCPGAHLLRSGTGRKPAISASNIWLAVRCHFLLLVDAGAAVALYERCGIACAVPAAGEFLYLFIWRRVFAGSADPTTFVRRDAVPAWAFWRAAKARRRWA